MKLDKLLRKSLSNQICSKLIENDSEENIINVLETTNNQFIN